MLSWTWNNTLTFNNSDLSIEIGFTSNGQHFDSLLFQKVDGVKYFGYCNGATCTLAYENGRWINSSFKNITFDTLPNEQLMGILSANATVSKNISKVEINGATLIDISNDTVAANILAEGYTAHDKTGNTITGTLTQQSGKTVTPGTSDAVVVESGKYTTGTVYVKGDSNLTANNIKSGTSIFGVTGSYAGSSPNLQSKSVTYTSNGTATVTPDSGYDGLSSVDVTVNVSSGSGGRGLIEGLELDGVSAGFTLKDISIEYCGFYNGDYYLISDGSNVTFAFCNFIDSNVHCTQEIHDAIVNGDNNDYSTSSFEIISHEV